MFDVFFWPIERILNISSKTLSALHRVKIYLLRDLIFYHPCSYQTKNINPDLSNLREGDLIQTQIKAQQIYGSVQGRTPIKILAYNDSGKIDLIFFNKIPTFIYNKFLAKDDLIITGKIQYFNNSYQITHPEFIFNDDVIESSIEPIYQLTYGLTNKQLYSYILKALKAIETEIANNKLSSITEFVNFLLKSFYNIHLYKYDYSDVNIFDLWQQATRNLAKHELIANQLSLTMVRKQLIKQLGKSFPKAQDLQNSVLARLGFSLTSAQEHVIDEIEQDQLSQYQMFRLLQGDVGSGKTLVALMTILNVIKSGSQAVLMAPTDLLANQHYNFFVRSLCNLGINIALLTGKISSREKKALYLKLESGEINILLGTHALFQEKVTFKDLRYIVIDEQHKFGVEQRLQLINKSLHPDVLIMTATPIPRSLTLTMFGDMACSKLVSKPMNRKPIITLSISNSKITDVIYSLEKRILSGEKIYWVCPLIDQNQEPVVERAIFDTNARAATINQIYPDIVGILHGKMNSNQKDYVMQQFKDGDIKILIATTIVEVGIDIPEATLIIIENAEQFGLAQLHQLRGRVGRGDRQSYCVLLYNSKKLSAIAKKRLEIMRASNDGFYIAEQDMLLRGSGEILGTRQSGEPNFFFADIQRDYDYLVGAKDFADNITELNELDKFCIKLFSRNSNNALNS